MIDLPSALSARPSALVGALHRGAAGSGDIGGTHLATALVLLDGELDGLAIAQGLVAITLNGGEMDEVVLAITSVDETETLLGVEKLDSSCLRHDGSMWLVITDQLKSSSNIVVPAVF